MIRFNVSFGPTSAVLMFLLAIPFVLLTGCTTAPLTDQEREQLVVYVNATIDRFTERDPTMEDLFDQAHAYAVFPEIVKGGAIVGGAHGHGMAFESGQFVGYCSVTQGTVGAQLGGQAYSQVIFFRNARAFQRFQAGDLSFSAQATAVAVTEGAAARADYDRDLKVFIMVDRGLMAEATIGGQRFDFRPAD